jgi:hypothetical protein
MNLMMITMGRDNVSELRPPPGLLFILQVMYELLDSWWNDVDRRKVILPPELSDNHTSNVIK